MGEKSETADMHETKNSSSSTLLRTFLLGLRNVSRLLEKFVKIAADGTAAKDRKVAQKGRTEVEFCSPMGQHWGKNRRRKILVKQ